MAATDTTPKAAALQLALYQSVGTARRAMIAVELSDAIRQTTLAGFRRRHPEHSEAELAQSFLRIVYGYGTER